MPERAGSPRQPVALSAFTLVELIVVIVIIGLVLAIAIPGISAMAADSAFNAGVQTVRVALTRANIAAQADRNMTAVRFLPGESDLAESDADEADRGAAPVGRQHLLTYNYRTTTDVESPPGSGNFKIEYSERFVRRAGSRSVRLPANVWVAPVETLSSVLVTDDDLGNGQIGEFQLDAKVSTFFWPDDFLVVFDPQTGLVNGSQTANRDSWRRFPLVGADLTVVPPRQTDRLLRYGHSGIVIYRREPLLALGAAADGKDRREVLKRFGRPYFVHRYSGGLVMGSQEDSQ